MSDLCLLAGDNNSQSHGLGGGTTKLLIAAGVLAVSGRQRFRFYCLKIKLPERNLVSRASVEVGEALPVCLTLFFGCYTLGSLDPGVILLLASRS